MGQGGTTYNTEVLHGRIALRAGSPSGLHIRCSGDLGGVWATGSLWLIHSSLQVCTLKHQFYSPHPHSLVTTISRSVCYKFDSLDIFCVFSSTNQMHGTGSQSRQASAAKVRLFIIFSLLWQLEPEYLWLRPSCSMSGFAVFPLQLLHFYHRAWWEIQDSRNKK